VQHPRSRIRRRTGRASTLGVVVALLVLVAYGALTGIDGGPFASGPAPSVGTAAPSSTPPPSGAAPPATGSTAELLRTLPVKGRAPKTGYDREGQFGTAWLDVDHNGCDTRNDILARDLTATVLAGRCRVMSGTLDDPYTGATVAFVRGETTSSLVQIDHVVALSNAWQTGAQQLGADDRERLANDPRNLLAVDGRSNQAKGDADAATWLPPDTTFRCDYVERQVEVKAAYALWVTPAERDAIERVLAGCIPPG
jgi:hypothetical protein